MKTRYEKHVDKRVKEMRERELKFRNDSFGVRKK